MSHDTPVLTLGILRETPPLRIMFLAAFKTAPAIIKALYLKDRWETDKIHTLRY